MSWFQRIAADAAKAGHHIEWITPAGFPVRPRAYKTIEHDIYIYPTPTKIRLQEDTKEINSNKAANGIVPHLVHSLDAAHLMLTLCELPADVTHFAAAHDCFGVHAANLVHVERALRKTLLAIYQTPILANLADQWRQEMGLEIDAPPTPPQPLDRDQIGAAPFPFC